MSSSNLAKALLAFQTDAPPIRLDATNPHYHSKFASLNGVVDAVRPVLNKHGLVYAQFPTNIDGAPALETMLIHAESGEDIAAVTPLVLSRNDPQGYGSALTYARRYALLSVLGLVGDEDDDAIDSAPVASRKAPDPHGLQESRADANVPVSQTVIPWGKHKGKSIADAPASYWEWWLGSDMAQKPEQQEFRAKVELHLGLTQPVPAGSSDLDDIPFAPSWI